MDEIIIEIDCLIIRIHEWEEKAYDMFEYGKWPSRDEFFDLEGITREVGRLYGIKDSLEELLESIKINNSID